MSTCSSAPPSLVDWQAILGADILGLDALELQQLWNALWQYSPRSVRLYARSTAQELPFAVRPVAWHHQGYWLSDSTVRPGAFLQHAAGDYYIQDAASMLAITLCDVQPGELVCDLCAAPGGKATGLLDQLAGNGYLLANEVIRSRVLLLEMALSRTGRANYGVTNLDVGELSELLFGHFDCVLVDAPCSGQSMVGNKKQTDSAFSAAQIEHSAARQARILAEAARLVRPAGRMVYSTCTFSVAENEALIETFLKQNPAWSLLPMQRLEPWSSPRLPGSYRLWPHRDDCHGGFAAALVFRGESTEPCSEGSMRKRRLRQLWQQWSGNLEPLEFLEMATPLTQSIWQNRDQLHLFADNPWPLETAQFFHASVPLAQRVGDRIQAEYGSAVVDLAGVQATDSIELDDQQAIRWVRGESIAVEPAGKNRWVQVRWRGRALSWGKLSQNRLNNHFPKIVRSSSITNC